MGERGAWAVMLALIAALSGGVALAASDKPEVEATTLDLIAGSGGQGKIASCGHGERVLGGGTTPTRLTPEPFDAPLIPSSGPLDASGSAANTRNGDAAKQWLGVARNQSDEARDFKVFAVCSPGT